VWPVRISSGPSYQKGITKGYKKGNINNLMLYTGLFIINGTVTQNNYTLPRENVMEEKR